MTILEKANQILADKEANLLPENLRDGITCLGVNGKLIELVGEEKSVIATTAEQEITPTEGYNGITKIIVRPVTNAIDANIKAENIKLGATILGVEGSYEGEILVYDKIENLPTDAKDKVLGIVITEETYQASNEDTVFGNRIYLPEQVVFETAPGELTGYIGLTPEDATIEVVNRAGSLTATEYHFILGINDGVTDVLDVSYTSEDGITYVRGDVSATGVFEFDVETNILTSSVSLIPYYDSELGENIYDTTGAYFLNELIAPEFMGLYQFINAGWVRIDLDTSSANATSTDIVAGRTAYVDGELIEGSVVEQASNSIESITLDVENVPLGWLTSYEENYLKIQAIQQLDVLCRANSGKDIKLSDALIANLIGLTADKIKAGETILGITGTYGETTEPTEPEEEPTVEPVTMSTGETYYITFADTIAEDIDLVEQATNNDLTIMSVDETTMIYCASAYLIGKTTVTDTGMDMNIYMDANVIAKLQELAGTENVIVNGTTDRGWKHAVMADGVYTIEDSTVPEPFYIDVGTLNYDGTTHDTLDVSAFNWLMPSIELYYDGPAVDDTIPDEEF